MMSLEAFIVQSLFLSLSRDDIVYKDSGVGYEWFNYDARLHLYYAKGSFNRRQRWFLADDVEPEVRFDPFYRVHTVTR